MSSSAIAAEHTTPTSTAASEDSTLFDGPEPRRAEPPDNGVIPNDQANALLEALQDICREVSTADQAAHPTQPAAATLKPAEPKTHLPRPAIDSPIDLTVDPCDIVECPPSSLVHNIASASANVTPTGRPMPELPPKGAIAALGVRKGGAAPRRIGSGRLVAARLTWKPRDPFADPAPAKRSQFRWDTMLTAACITAACGLGCLWLLRSLLT